MNPLFTIGHSNHDFSRFLGLLKQHEIDVVADVRSRPFSRLSWFCGPALKKREIEKRIDPELVKGGCLLCSEDKPHHCHRRPVTEYLKRHWGDLEIRHLV